MGHSKIYTGQKGIEGVYQKIINKIPVHSNYFEVFAGSGFIGKKLSEIVKKKVSYNFIDKDPTVKKFYPAEHNFINSDFRSFLNDHKFNSNDFLFFDPPYHPKTRMNKKLYNYEMNEDDHSDLLQLIRTIPAKIMIIHPVCDIYEIAFQHWNKVNVTVRYHNKTSYEAIYMNYPDPAELQTYLYLGSNCWDRQAIKRQSNRIIKKFESLDPTVRNNLLQQLNNYFL